MPENEARLYILNYIENLPNREKLQCYYDFYKHLPQQGTKAWEKNRKIGASEVAAILGECPYSDCKRVAYRLLKLEKFEKQLVTQWGNIFEVVAKKYLSQYIDIYEFSSLPGFGVPVVTSCSPDGIFLFNRELMPMIEKPHDIEQESPCLLEIKCPFNRKLNKIPNHYMPQLYMGMSTVNFTKHALFCEFVFRCCSIQDFNYSRNCKTVGQHKPEFAPEFIGFIILYGKCEHQNPISMGDVNFTPTGDDVLLQMGELNRACGDCPDIEKILIFKKYFSMAHISEYFREKIVDWDYCDFGATENFLYKWSDNFEDILLARDYYYSPICPRGSDWDCKTWMQTEIAKAPQENIMGIMPYKMYHKKLYTVEKIPYKEQILKILDFAKKINEMPKDGDLYETLDKMF
jgi:hypothetical protein